MTSRSSNGTGARPVSIEISKPFVSYVVQEQMRTDDADVFVFLLPFEVEDINKTGEWRRGPWKYSDVQKAIDEKGGVDRLKLRPGRVLYVGEAAGQSLRDRLATYLVDFRQPKRHEDHKGKGFVLAARSGSGDHGVFASWVECGASPSGIHVLEASLIHYLNPAANDRVEETRHPTLADHERIDDRLIR